MDALLSGLEALDRELQSSEAGEDSIKMPPRPPESMTMESFVEHRVPLRVVRDSLSVSLAHGLSRDTVHRRIEELGYNEPPEGLPPPRCFAFWGGGFPPSDAWVRASILLMHARGIALIAPSHCDFQCAAVVDQCPRAFGDASARAARRTASAAAQRQASARRRGATRGGGCGTSRPPSARV